MKTNDKKNKSNSLFMLLVIFLISAILCISSFGIATWARYRSVVGNNIVAQITKWSFKVNGEEEQFADINLADTISFEHVENSTIAPGTYGCFDLDIDGRGSEVSLDYYVNINVINKPTNLKFYSDAGYTTPISVTIDNKVYLNGDLLLTEQSMQEIRTIYWKWDYRTEIMPNIDILQGYYSSIDGLEALVNEYNDNGITAEQKQELAMKINDKIDTYEQGGDVLLDVSVKGVQINPNFALKSVQIVSQTDKKYDVGESVNIEVEFTENVYADNNQTIIDSTNAPEVIVGFETTANNSIVKVASLVNTNIQLSIGGNIATFVSVDGNKLNYTYTIKSANNGNIRISNITGTVYNKDGKLLDLGTISVPQIINGTISTNATLQSILSTATLGQYVDLGTDILDKSIALEDGSYPETDWRVFKKDSNGTWLILADYLPLNKLPVGTGLSESTQPYYCLNSNNLTNLLNGLNSSVWKSLILENRNLYNNENVIVKGAFT